MGSNDGTSIPEASDRTAEAAQQHTCASNEVHKYILNDPAPLLLSFLAACCPQPALAHRLPWSVAFGVMPAMPTATGPLELGPSAMAHALGKLR